MRPGDDQTIILNDMNLKDNLILLLNAMPGLRFQVRNAGGICHMNIRKVQ